MYGSEILSRCLASLGFVLCCAVWIETDSGIGGD